MIFLKLIGLLPLNSTGSLFKDWSIEFIKSREDEGREMRQAKLYVTPDLIGGNQPTFQDEVTLTYAGASQTAQIVEIDTKKGGQAYLFTLLVNF